jgi:septal ring factor EnvC (AmiA/AmiB activator)
MPATNGHATLSLEDSVRAILRTPEERQAFREKWPMYETAKLKAEIEKADSDIAQFEAAIQKAQRYKRECKDLIDQCEKRDNVLKQMRKS